MEIKMVLFLPATPSVPVSRQVLDGCQPGPGQGGGTARDRARHRAA